MAVQECHIQCSPDPEDCERCAQMFPAVNPTIESGEDYFIIIYDDGRHENVCVAHFATLQLSEL